jgi:DNA polymerase
LGKKGILLHSLLKWHYTNNVISFLAFQANESSFSYKDQNTLHSNNVDLIEDEINKNEIKQVIIQANNLEALKKEVEGLDECALKKTATNIVFSDGNCKANVMVVGEAPGEEEDKLGKPFKGQAGNLLDKMLQAIGQNRENTYITNLIFWRPPGNRSPTQEEINICLPYALKHIEIINPKILILTGAIATKAILRQNNKGIIQLRGKWQNFSINKSTSIKTMPIFHPAFLLRQPSRKREAWEDLKKIKQEIDLIT